MAGGQHGVEDEALAARQVVRQAVRVGLDLQGVVVATHAQEANLGRGQHASHALEHAQACAQDGDHDRARLGELQADRGGDGVSMGVSVTATSRVAS